jgi:hypothetical protein
MLQHTVDQGECFSSLARRYGFPTIDALWTHPANADLRQKRQDPNVLFPGDVVAIPEKELREEARPTDQRHKFRKTDSPAKVRIRLMDGDQPRRNVPYELRVDGNVLKGTTDRLGFLEHPVAPDAKAGSLLVGNGPTKDLFAWQFGTVDPIETDEGVRGRLIDLGYDVENLAEAIKAFQQASNLSATGQADDATRSRLKERFGQ